MILKLEVPYAIQMKKRKGKLQTHHAVMSSKIEMSTHHFLGLEGGFRGQKFPTKWSGFMQAKLALADEYTVKDATKTAEA